MNLIPKFLRDLFKKKEDPVHQYQFDVETDLSWVVKELAQHKGWSERDVLTDLTQLGKEQLHNAKKVVELWRTLSVREQEVVALVCMGLRNYEIAQTMSITYGTAKSHLNSVFKKLNLHERGAIREAFKGWNFEAWWDDPHRQRGNAFTPTISE